MKKAKNLDQALQNYVSLFLDMQAATDPKNKAKHQKELDYLLKLFEQNNDDFSTLVSGSGTGKT